MLALEAVPLCSVTSFCSTRIAVCAMAGSMICLHGGAALIPAGFLPSYVVILVIGVAGQWLPLFTIVPYAEAISRMLVFATPRVNETCCSAMVCLASGR